MFRCFPVAFVTATTFFACCTQIDDVSVAQNNALRDSTSVETENKLNEYRFDWVPMNTLGVIAFRPAQVLAEEVVEPVRALVFEESQYNQSVGLCVKPTGMESVIVISIVVRPKSDNRKMIDFVSVVKSTKVIDRKEVRKKSLQINDANPLREASVDR